MGWMDEADLEQMRRCMMGRVIRVIRTRIKMLVLFVALDPVRGRVRGEGLVRGRGIVPVGTTRLLRIRGG